MSQPGPCVFGLDDLNTVRRLARLLYDALEEFAVSLPAPVMDALDYQARDHFNLARDVAYELRQETAVLYQSVTEHDGRIVRVARNHRGGWPYPHDEFKPRRPAKIAAAAPAGKTRPMNGGAVA